MGLTVAQVIERSREEIFQAGGVARPGWDVQEGLLAIDGLVLTVEGRHPNIPPNSILEWEDDSMEVAESKSVSGTAVTLQTRGYLGSSPAEHADGTKVLVNPPYHRYVLVNALKAVIGQLFGYGLYAVANSAGLLTYSSYEPVTLPTGAKDIVGSTIWVFDGRNYHPLERGTDWRFIRALTPPKVQFLGGWAGRAIYFDYKKDFDTSTFALATDLDTAGIPATLQQHLATAVAGHVLMGRDVPSLEAEHIQPDPQAPQQPGIRANVGLRLWQTFLAGPVAAEHRRQLQENPTQIIFEGNP